MSRFGWMAAAVALAGACEGEPPASRCESLCAREATCAAERAPDDGAGAREYECTRACEMFARDPEMRLEVDRRAECVAGAADCGAVLACGEP